MKRIEKTVFLSYRRTNIAWALAIFQNLKLHGYDVFFDYNGIGSGDFERVILENITSRAHFLVLLTPSALERCDNPEDWLRREIETALNSRRNIVPVMLEGFDFETPTIASKLTGTLAAVKKYNSERIPPDFFDEAMERLRERFLNVRLTAVLHPASLAAKQAAIEQKDAAEAAPTVPERELAAQRWFERAFSAVGVDEKIPLYTEAIRLKPDYAAAFLNRGIVRKDKGDVDGAIKDYSEAIRLKPNNANALNNRGNARMAEGDFQGAIVDYSEAIRLKPDFAIALNNRGIAVRRKAKEVSAQAAARRLPEENASLHRKPVQEKTSLVITIFSWTFVVLGVIVSLSVIGWLIAFTYIFVKESATEIIAGQHSKSYLNMSLYGGVILLLVSVVVQVIRRIIRAWS